MLYLEEWNKNSSEQLYSDKRNKHFYENMAGKVHLDGKEVDVGVAEQAISTSVKKLQETLDQTIAEGLDKTNLATNMMDMTLAAGQIRPSFDLVSSINVFDGSQPNLVKHFFDNINSMGDISGWNETHKLQVIKIMLTGCALQFFNSDETCKNATSCQEVKDVFLDRFGKSLPDHYYFEQLALIKQTRNESIENFADRVKRTCDRTVKTTQNPEVNKVLKDEADRLAMEAFVRGLSGEVGRQTRIKFPKSYREAVTTAIALQNLDVRPSTEEEKPRRVFNTSRISMIHRL